VCWPTVLCGLPSQHLFRLPVFPTSVLVLFRQSSRGLIISEAARIRREATMSSPKSPRRRSKRIKSLDQTTSRSRQLDESMASPIVELATQILERHGAQETLISSQAVNRPMRAAPSGSPDVEAVIEHLRNDVHGLVNIAMDLLQRVARSSRPIFQRTSRGTMRIERPS
jgi:hypothetical protein